MHYGKCRIQYVKLIQFTPRKHAYISVSVVKEATDVLFDHEGPTNCVFSPISGTNMSI